MFTLEQINTAHSTVRSGADFPAYVRRMKELGVSSYTLFVADGHSAYEGTDAYCLQGPAKWAPMLIAADAAPEQLQQALRLHQQGGSGYAEFCHQVAAAGVDHWRVDLLALTCSYYDREARLLLEEQIPA